VEIRKTHENVRGCDRYVLLRIVDILHYQKNMIKETMLSEKKHNLV